jgi:hypothetical protein
MEQLAAMCGIKQTKDFEDENFGLFFKVLVENFNLVNF